MPLVQFLSGYINLTKKLKFTITEMTLWNFESTHSF